MARILVVCFSRSGATDMAAERLARVLGADLDKVHPLGDYAGAGGFMKGVLQSVRRTAPPVGSSRDPRAYDVVVLGTPVWAGRLSAPLRGYLKLNASRLRAVGAFCVSGSGQAYPEVFREIMALGAPTPWATLSLGEREVRSGLAGPKLDAFAARLAAGAPGEAAEAA